MKPLMKTLLEKGLLHGDCITVTGNSLEDNLKNIESYKDDEIIKTFENPIKNDSHLRILYGNLAKDGAVAKITGKEGTSFEGKAKVFNSEEEGVDAILSNTSGCGTTLKDYGFIFRDDKNLTKKAKKISEWNRNEWIRIF